MTATPHTDWLAALSPWPKEFGLGRMQRLLAELGDPQRSFRAIHVVGTNGKTSTTRMAAALLRDEGLRTGSYVSPHVTSWGERIQVDGADCDFEEAVGRVRPYSDGVPQFEVLTAAAFAQFAACGVEVAVVEAGLGGRLDATNVLNAAVVVLTNVALEHTEILGGTREAIAAEKLAVITPGARLVLGEPEWEAAARAAGAVSVRVETGGNAAVAAAEVSELLGREVSPQLLAVPGRFDVRSETPFEVWDGAHNPAGMRYLVEQLPDRRFVVVASILGDKGVDEMLATLAPHTDHLVATESHNPRVLTAEALAEHARRYVANVHVVTDPLAALNAARTLASDDGAVLVTGSLYLLAELLGDAS